MFVPIMGKRRKWQIDIACYYFHILGNYAMQTPTETLLAKQRGDIPNDIARLNGPRFVTALEAPQGRRLAESLVKQLTGQDTISARFFFGEYFDFKPQFKLFFRNKSQASN